MIYTDLHDPGQSAFHRKKQSQKLGSDSTVLREPGVQRQLHYIARWDKHKPVSETQKRKSSFPSPSVYSLLLSKKVLMSLKVQILAFKDKLFQNVIFFQNCFNSIIIHICTCIYRCIPIYTWGGMCTWKSENNLEELVLSFYHMGHRDQTWILRIGGKPSYPLSHPDNPKNVSFSWTRHY